MKPGSLTSWVPAPRLLPLTIAMLVVVLGARIISLIQATLTQGPVSGLIAAARAGGHGAPTPKPAPAHGAKPAPAHGGKTEPKPDAKQPPAQPEPAVVEMKPPEGPPPISESERALLLQLRERRTELEGREAALATRELMLAAAERKLASRVEELQTLQKQLESLDANRRQQEDNAWRGLVKTYETMKPREAAVIFNDLSMPVVLAVLDRMKEAKAAAILAAMTPDKAREVTARLAQTRAGALPDKPASAKPPGG